jgi:cell division septal protein FtsQ
MNKVALMTEKGRKRRGNSRFIIFFILILIMLGVASWGIYQWLGNASWLNVRKIRVTGAENVSFTSIKTLVQEYMGDNLVKLSGRDVKNKVLRINRIEKVTLTRLYPGTLKIRILERKGYLYIKSSEGDLFPVDEKGMVMEHAIYPTKEDLPIVNSTLSGLQLIVGKVVKDDFVQKVISLQKQILAERPDFLKSVSEYYQDNGYTMIVDAIYGTRILLGSEDLKDQLRRYQFVQENSDLDRNKIFDLRYKNQIVVRQEVQ